MPSPVAEPITVAPSYAAGALAGGGPDTAPRSHLACVPVQAINNAAHAAHAAPPCNDAAALSGHLPAVPRELWLLLPERSRLQIEQDVRAMGDACLDPERMIPHATELQRQARADYRDLAARCSAGPCFALSTPTMGSTASASLAFWCRLRADARWEVIAALPRDGGWQLQLPEAAGELHALKGVMFENLEQIKGALLAHGLLELKPDPAAVADSLDCVRGAAMRLLRLCNGGAPR